tara:strand:+ start:1380 stop:2024 length:645 start_codon:yes stop_codon:yes gene_type:complete
MANLEKLLPPATRRQFSSLGDALMQSPEYIRRGLSELVNVPSMVDDVRRQGYPSATNLGLAALGPAGALQGQIVKGGLRLLPATGIFTGSNLLADAVPVVGKAIKKTAAPAAAGAAMTPATVDEAEAGGLKNLILKLADQINTTTPTLLRPKGQGIGERMPKKIAEQEQLLKTELSKMSTTPKQNENIANIFNSQEYTVEQILAAVKEALKFGD